MAEVVLDRLRAEEHRRRRLARRLATCQQPCDLELLRGQLVERARVAAARRFASRLQLGACLVGPGVRAERLELGQGCAQLLACPDALTRAAQARAVGEPGAGALEAVRCPH